MTKIPHSYPFIDEGVKQSLVATIERNYIGFDAQLDASIVAEIKHVFAMPFITVTPSASAALLIVLRALRLTPDDEVVFSAINCPSVYHIIRLASAKPVVCDVRATDDFRADFTTIAAQITDKTRCIIVTHMFGYLIEPDVIRQLKRAYPQVKIIEDFSTSFPATRPEYITSADFVVLSFGSTKPVAGGIGGAVLSSVSFFSTQYDCVSSDYPAVNVKLSALDQIVILSALRSFGQVAFKKYKLHHYLSQFCVIYGFTDNGTNKINLFRAITFEQPDALLNKMARIGLQLELRQSAQPNLAQQMGLTDLVFAYSFKPYYSIPSHIFLYDSLLLLGEIEEMA
jgi:dTDP-4-amino-4,6-dideoxygalactose transaminase